MAKPSKPSTEHVAADLSEELVSRESKGERLKREERVLRQQIDNFRTADQLSRDEVHRRRG
jgi:hypothetical protein